MYIWGGCKCMQMLQMHANANTTLTPEKFV